MGTTILLVHSALAALRQGLEAGPLHPATWDPRTPRCGLQLPGPAVGAELRPHRVPTGDPRQGCVGRRPATLPAWPTTPPPWAVARAGMRDAARRSVLEVSVPWRWRVCPSRGTVRVGLPPAIADRSSPRSGPAQPGRGAGRGGGGAGALRGATHHGAAAAPGGGDGGAVGRRHGAPHPRDGAARAGRPGPRLQLHDGPRAREGPRVLGLPGAAGALERHPGTSS